VILPPTSDWFTLGLSLDGAAFAGYLAAYYKYGDRTDVFKNSLAGTRELLAKIESEISFRLALHLEPVFSESNTVIRISPVLQADGSLVRVSPIGSEKYRSAIREFVLAHNQALIAYRVVNDSKRSWMRCAQRLSWFLLIGILAHGFMGFTLVLVRLVGLDVPITAFGYGLGMSFILLICAFTCAMGLLRSHSAVQGPLWR
jgi:hypothetical protein